MNSLALKQTRKRPWRLLPVLDLMVIGDLAVTSLSVSLVLVSIVVSRKFLNILAKALEGDVAAETLFSLLSLKTLSVAIFLLPPTLFLSALMVFGRMYRDHEMTILASSGVGPARLYRAAAYFVIPLFLFAGWGAIEVMPWAERHAQELMKRDEKSADIRGIKPGRFNEFSGGDVVLYAESLATTSSLLNNVFVQSRDGDRAGIVLANRGYLKTSEGGETFVVLQDGKRYQGTPGQQNFIVTEFDEYAVRVDESASKSAATKREALPFDYLLSSKIPREIVELQRRVSIPMGVLVLAVLALPLARLSPRSGVYGNVLKAFLIFIAYENLQKSIQAMTVTGKLPQWAGYSVTYVIMLSIALVLLVIGNGGLSVLRWPSRIREGLR